jgi:hypothetical protein
MWKYDSEKETWLYGDKIIGAGVYFNKVTNKYTSKIVYLYLKEEFDSDTLEDAKNRSVERIKLIKNENNG